MPPDGKGAQAAGAATAAVGGGPRRNGVDLRLMDYGLCCRRRRPRVAAAAADSTSGAAAHGSSGDVSMSRDAAALADEAVWSLYPPTEARTQSLCAAVGRTKMA